MTARSHATALARRITLGLLGLMLCLWLVIVVSVSSVWTASLEHATASANNLSAAFREQVTQTMDRIGTAMDVAAREIRADSIHLPLDHWAESLPALAPPTMYASFVDPAGKVVLNTLAPRTTGTDVSDREHFRVHLRTKSEALYVSVPETGRLSGLQTIQVSKRVNDAEGRFLGVLVFSVAPDNLTGLHRAVDLGPRGVMALAGTDGRLRARFGGTPDESAVKVGGDWPVMPDAGASEQVSTSIAADGISRIYSLRRLQNYPLIVAVGLSLDDEMADARTHAFLAIGIAIVASVLLAVLHTLLVREIRRRTERETDLAREQEALEAARADLVTERRKLAKANQELLLSGKRVETANQAKSQFLAQMSHELRTPLNAVIGFSELITYQASPLPAANKIAGYAADIMKSGRHLLELINSILDLSKIESGMAKLSEEAVSLSGVIEDSLVTIREQAREAGILLDTRAPPDLPWILGDATKLRQILINLLSNAVKFTLKNGSVCVSARRETGGAFSVIVSDTGIGMSDAEMLVAMEPFGQVENSLARSFQGTGLGLPLARRMTELHGGRLTLHSVKGVGTTVEVRLPANRVRWPQDTSPHAARSMQGASD